MSKKVFYVILVLSLVLNFSLGTWLVLSKLALKEANAQIKAQLVNEKTLFFTKLLVQEVMQSKDEITFDNRLKLENAVRDLNDYKIFNQWQKFTKSKDNSEAQQEAGSLFALLLDKISY